MAACPAAVAASLERFLSASEMRSKTPMSVCMINEHGRDGPPLTGFLFSFDICDYCFDLSQVEVLQVIRCSEDDAATEEDTHCDFSIALHHADLDILRACLYNLKQALYSQLDTLLPRQIVFVVLLQEFTDGFGRAANGIRLFRTRVLLSVLGGRKKMGDITHLPSTVDTTGFCLVQSRSVVIRVEANDESGDAERTNTTRLGVPL
jgi:hypothetical protein